MNRPPRPYPAIDLLRGFSALTILVFHVIVLSNWTSFPDSGPFVWFRISFLRVDLFFVLSGFLITLAAMREQARGDGARGRFLWRRIARIAPPYYVACLAWLALHDFEMLRRPDAAFQIGTHLSFTHSFFDTTIASLNAPTWTLGIEMQLYLVTALALPLLAGLPPLRTALVALLIGLAWRVASQVLQIDVMGLDPRTAPLWRWSVQVPGMIDMFGIGVATAVWVSRRGTPQPSTSRWLAVLVLALVLSTGLVSALWRNGMDYWLMPFWGSGFRTLVAVVAMLWLWLAVALPGAWVPRVPRWLIYPGTISYGLYLWHLPVAEALIMHTTLREGSLLVACLGVTGLIAAASWHFLETPVMNWARRRTAPRRTATPDAPAAAPPPA